MQKRFPADGLALILYAHALLLKAKMIKNPIKKVRLLNQGLVLMDKANLMMDNIIKAYGAEGGVWVSMIRLISYEALPVSFRRDAQIYAEFQQLFDRPLYDKIADCDQEMAQVSYKRLHNRYKHNSSKKK